MAETPSTAYGDIVAIWESFLDKYGDSQSGVGWLRWDAETRYRVMLDVIRPSPAPVTLLDFGCGLSHLYDYIFRYGIAGIEYSGLDISERFPALSRKKFPAVAYYLTGVLEEGALSLPPFDYVIMNGIFTYKSHLSHAEMFAHLRSPVHRAFDLASIGIAFNVMTKQVEWERDDLFHLPVDTLLTFLSH